MKIYRSMTPAEDGLPVVGRSARQLGVRTPVEVPDGDPDVTVQSADEIILPGTGGMSVAPNDPINLPPFRRPVVLGGKGRDPVWVLDTADLGSDLQFRQDSATHGLIEPARPVTLNEYEAAVAATRSKWVRHTG